MEETEEPPSTRPRKPTERGLSYRTEMVEKQISSLYRDLEKRSKLIQQQIEEPYNDAHNIQKSYCAWLAVYEQFLCSKNEYSMITEAELVNFYSEKDSTLCSFKSKMEEWFKTNPAGRPSSRMNEDDVRPCDSVSQTSKRSARSDRSSSLSSSLSSLRMKEEQRQAELTARKATLMRKQQIELAKFNLKQQEEQLDIETDLAVSRARAKVLDNYELNTGNTDNTTCISHTSKPGTDSNNMIDNTHDVTRASAPGNYNSTGVHTHDVTVARASAPGNYIPTGDVTVTRASAPGNYNSSGVHTHDVTVARASAPGNYNSTGVHTHDVTVARASAPGNYIPTGDVTVTRGSAPGNYNSTGVHTHDVTVTRASAPGNYIPTGDVTVTRASVPGNYNSTGVHTHDVSVAGGCAPGNYNSTGVHTHDITVERASAPGNYIPTGDVTVTRASAPGNYNSTGVHTHDVTVARASAPGNYIPTGDVTVTRASAPGNYNPTGAHINDVTVTRASAPGNYNPTGVVHDVIVSRPSAQFNFDNNASPTVVSNDPVPVLRANAPVFQPSNNVFNDIAENSTFNAKYNMHYPTASNDRDPYAVNINANCYRPALKDLHSADLQSPITVYGGSQHQIDSVVRQLRKPPPEIQKFSGDPLEYKRFLRQFHSKIVINTDEDIEKMNYLEQYTSGEAYRIVSGFSYLDATTGYRLALNELEKRYGNKEVLANAFVNRALNWTVIKADNPRQMDEFGIFLMECHNAIQCIEAVKVLEYPDNLKRLVSKLPYFYHDKWRNIVHQNRERGQLTSFSQLVAFVKSESQKANDPTYGREALNIGIKDSKARVQSPKPTANRYKGSYATQVSDSPQTGAKENQIKGNSQQILNSNGRTVPTVLAGERTAFSKPCLYCEGPGHCFEVCRKLKALPYEERIDIIKKHGLCFGCLKKGHRSKDCRNKSICEKCNGKHPSICHVDGKVPQLSDSKVYQSSDVSTDTKSISSACSNLYSGAHHDMRAGDGECMMAIIPVSVKMENGMKIIQTYAFLDPGSTASFCTDNLIRKLGASGKRMKITLDTMGSPHTMETTAVNGLVVSDLNCENFITLPKVYTKQAMPVTTGHIPTNKDLQKWPHLHDVKLPSIKADVELLIGNNVPDAYTPTEIRTGPRGSPHSTKTLLGWIAWNIIRPKSRTDATNSVCVNRAAITAVEDLQHLDRLNKILLKSISLDYPEHIIDDKREHSVEDKKFLAKVNSSMKLIDGHYCIKLPFKTDDAKLPNNELLARQRLRSLKTKMETNQKLFDDYKGFMSDILAKGYAEKVPTKELSRDDGRVWYIPHHAVYHPRKPEKIRVVFDCAVVYRGVSLNNLLLQGPDLTNNLLSVLLRFRQDRVALTGDIEAMFYQVRVPKEDSDCLRFLWWPNGDTSKEPSVYRMVVHLFGAASSPSCSNAALLRTVYDNSDHFSNTVCSVIQKNFYVDDCVTSKNSEEEAVNLIKDLTDLCQRGGFHITKWSSNSRNVIQSVDASERAKEVKDLNLDCDSLPNERVLGIYWSAEKDALSFDIKVRDQPFTKRGILSVTSSIYDPLGLASPFVLTARIILQELCRLGIDWDENIPRAIKDSWKRWVSELSQLEQI